MRIRTQAAVAALLLIVTLLPTGAGAGATGGGSGPSRFLVFNGEGNRLNAYDHSTGRKQTVIPSAADASATPDPGDVGLDINAQICVHHFDGKTFFIAGEDTDQDTTGEPGWGWFELIGDEIGSLSAVEHGKLIPSWTQASGQENYGCGFLPNGDLVLSDVGDQLPHEPATGQLHLWYLDPATGFDDPTYVNVATGEHGGIDNRTDGEVTGQRYCKIDTSIATAGGVMVDEQWIYVASNRPGSNGPGGIYRYRIADFPAAGSNCAGRGDQADLVDAGVVTRQLWLPSDAFVLTPSAVAPTGRQFQGHPTYYVSSVFTGIIAEYADLGAARVHLRNVVEPPLGLPIGQVWPTGTPYGIGVGPDGSLWYADLGIVGPGPIPELGSVQRVTFDSHGAVRDHLVVDDQLDFPDGIGILDLGVVAPIATDGELPEVTDPSASSERSCEWAMYGHGRTRDFSLPDGCRSPITPTSVATLRPKWKVKTARTVTASPAVAGGRVYVGDWSGTMYAVDVHSGAVRWTYPVEPAPGAAFGPIVSSAAVAEVRYGAVDTRRLVIFGAGPRLYALRDRGGSATPQWVTSFDDDPASVVEIESSPVVWRGIVYVGLGNHNHAWTGVPGGLVALDAGTGAVLWKFSPEQGTDAGCGTVWSSPTVNTDATRPLVYLATGNCTSDTFVWNRNTEAVTALDARTGEAVWTFQPHVTNRKDWDFGATPNLFTDDSGRRVLGIGNKDGAYYALHPQTGQQLWSTKVVLPGDVGEDFSIGGFIASTGAQRGKVFGSTAIGGPLYYHSLDGDTGKVRWRGVQAPSYAASAGVNGVVFTASLDSLVRAYHLDTGVPLWSSPLLGPGSSGPAVVGDSVYVGSGTSSPDVCAKELPANELCQALVDTGIGGLGGIEAFQLPLPLPRLREISLGSISSVSPPLSCTPRPVCHAAAGRFACPSPFLRGPHAPTP